MSNALTPPQQFNCAQRAHQNTLESVPFILASTAFLGLFHPKAATAGALSWVFGRIFYTVSGLDCSWRCDLD